MKKIGILILVLSALCFCGCNKEELENKKTNIVVVNGYGGMSQGDISMRNIYKDFEVQHPDISLTLISIPESGHLEKKVKDMLAVGKIPNIIGGTGDGNNELYQFMVDSGYALNLQDYIEQDETFKNNISGKILNKWQDDEGRIYTVPDVISTQGYWYNKKIFENAGITKLPTTWDEFYQVCKKINSWSKSIRLDTIPIHMDTKTAALILNIMLQDEEPEAAISRLKELCTETKVETAEFSEQDKMRSFNSGHSAICTGSVSDGELIVNNMDAEFALFPSVYGEPIGYRCFHSGYIVSNLGDEDQKKASIEFLKYMVSEEVQKRIYENTGKYPQNEKIDIAGLKINNAAIRKGYETLDSGQILDETPVNIWGNENYTRFENKICEILTAE